MFCLKCGQPIAKLADGSVYHTTAETYPQLNDHEATMSKVYYPAGKPEPCHWCHKDCGGTCLQLTKSTQMKTDDPAYFMLSDNTPKTPKPVHRQDCYICEDPEFAQMGLPLCQPCPKCSKQEIQGGASATKGHIPADNPVCDDCGYDMMEEYYIEMERRSKGVS